MSLSKIRIVIGLGLVLAVRLGAQQVLYIENNGKPALVRAVRDGYAYVQVGEKLVRVSRNSKLGLVDAQEFLPYFVSVRDLRAGSSYLNLTVDGGTSGDVNHQFEFEATFESQFQLQDVFFVLELSLESGKSLFYYEVGDLEPRHPQHVRVLVPMSSRLGAGHFKLHLYTQGAEVLHSEQPPLYREQVLDRMVLQRLAGVSAAPLRPFVGPAPEYPPALLKNKVSGAATVRFRLTPRGAVLDPVVVSATAPEFGESALAATRLWRFLPQVKNGRPVGGTVEFPFNFSPPPDKK